MATSPNPVVWSGGGNFNGYLFLALQLPQGYSQPTLINSYVQQQLGRYIRVPIVNGTIDTTTAIPWNSDIDPPDTAYVAYFFDNSNALIAPTSGSASPFSVGSATFTINVPSLPRPNYSGVTPPVPQVSSHP